MAITDRAICTEEGSFTFNGVAGGTFAAGDALEIDANGKILKGDGSLSFVGVADHGAVSGDNVAFYGPGGNKVWGNQGTNGVSVGDKVIVDSDGGFTTYVWNPGTTTPASDGGKIIGVCLEKESTTYCKILLY